MPTEEILSSINKEDHEVPKAIEKIIPDNPSEREIKRVAKGQGLLSMRQDGIIKIMSGVTSLEEVASVVDLNEE